MLRSRITVTADTDVVRELAALRDAARRQRLSDHVIAGLVASVESSLAALKEQAVQSSVHGINISVSQTLCEKDYKVTLEIADKKAAMSKKRFFGIFGK